MPTVEDMVIRINGDINGLQRELTKGERAVGGFTDKVDRSFSGLSSRMLSFARGFGGTLTAGLTAGGALAAIRNVVSDVGNLADIAEKIGVSAVSLQELRFAAVEAGSSTGQLDDALSKFAINVANARQGQGDLNDVLKTFGVELTDSDGKTRDLQAVLSDFSDIVQATNDPTEQLRLTTLAFGRGADELVGILRNGSKGLDDFRQTAHDTGQVIDENLVKMADELDDRINRISRTISVTFKASVLEFVNGISEVLGLAQKAAYSSQQIVLGAISNDPAAQKKAIDAFYGDTGKSVASDVPQKQQNVLGSTDQITSRLKLALKTGKTSATLQSLTSPLLIPTDEQMKKTKEGLSKVKDEVSKIGSASRATHNEVDNLFENFNSDIANAIASGDKFSDVLKKIAGSFAEVALNSGVKPYLQNLFTGSGGGLSAGGIPIPGRKPSQGGIFGNLIGSLGSLFKFADGGIMTGMGSMPLRRYASGGIASSPQMAMFGEGSRPEAYVPLPDGRTIPVSLRGGSGGVSVTQNINIDARGANEGFISQWPAMKAALINETKAAVAAEVSRGGSYARAIGKR